MADDQPPADPPKTDPPGTDPPKSDPPPSTDPPATGTDNEALRKIVREELAKLTDAGEPRTAGTSRLATIEANAERMVREAAERLRTEEEEKKRITSLEDKVKAVTEKPPRTTRRITKALWGEDDRP